MSPQPATAPLRTPPPPTRSEHFLSIQILRGLAAVLVLLHHGIQVVFTWLPDPRFAWLDRGAFGVDLFFPISGFVIHLSTQILRQRNPHQSIWRSFAERRFLRVAPFYWLCTVAKLLIFLAAPAAMRYYRFQLWNTIASFLFLFSYNSRGLPEPVLPVGWTLNYEMFFYAVVAAALLLRLPLLRFCAAVLIPLALLGPFLSHRSALAFFAAPIELEFLGGMLLAASIPHLRRIPAALAWATAIAALLFVFLHDPGGFFDFNPWRALVWGVPGLLIVASAVALEGHFPFRRYRKLLLLGDASYALYLTHTFILPLLGPLAALAHLHGPTGSLALLAAGCAVGIPFAILVHLRFELPMLRVLLHRRTPWSLRSAQSAD